MSATNDYITTKFTESSAPCLEFTGKCQGCGEPVSVIVFANDRDNPEGTGGMIVGSQWNASPEFKCSKCLENDGGKISPTRCEVFSRVVGYLRPITSWNKGKRAEKDMRVDYKF